MCTLGEEARVSGTPVKGHIALGAFGEHAQGLKWIYTSALWLLAALHLGLRGRIHWPAVCMPVCVGGGCNSPSYSSPLGSEVTLLSLRAAFAGSPAASTRPFFLGEVLIKPR